MGIYNNTKISKKAFKKLKLCYNRTNVREDDQLRGYFPCLVHRHRNAPQCMRRTGGENNELYNNAH